MEASVALGGGGERGEREGRGREGRREGEREEWGRKRREWGEGGRGGRRERGAMYSPLTNHVCVM